MKNTSKDFTKKEETTRDFKPVFYITDDIDECADAINKPHEDYPKRVPVTKELIQKLVDLEVPNIDQTILWNIHSLLFRENPRRIRVGAFRMKNVTVAGEPTPDHTKIYDMMACILPVNKDSNLEEWYRSFQLIHPFEDGNGRVGGIVIAILSFLKNKKYLTPEQ